MSAFIVVTQDILQGYLQSTIDIWTSKMTIELRSLIDDSSCNVIATDTIPVCLDQHQENDPN